MFHVFESLKHHKIIREAGHKPRRLHETVNTPEKGNFDNHGLIKKTVYIKHRVRNKPRQFETVV